MALARIPKQIGAALRRYRTLKGMSQSELGSRAGLRQGTISLMEGGHGATKVETLCSVLAALDLELAIAPRSKSSPQDIEDIF